MNKLYQFYCRHSLAGFHLVLLAAAGILCLVNYYTKDPFFADCAYAVFIVDIFSVLIHTNQQGIYDYMRMNKDVSHVPKQQIYLINTLLLAGFLILTGGCMFLFVHLPYREIITAIKTAFITIIRWIVQLFFHHSPAQKEELATPEMESFFQSLPQSEGPSWFARILEYLFLIIAFVSIAAILVMLLVAIYRKLVTRREGTELDKREFVSPKMERKKVERTVSQEKLHFFNRSTEGRIRKLYYRSIRRHLRSGKMPSRSMTPSQIEALASLPQSPGADQLHEAYEKARYDTESCVKEDLEKAKDGVSRLTGKH